MSTERHQDGQPATSSTAAKLELSLDELIASSKKQQQTSRGGYTNPSHSRHRPYNHTQQHSHQRSSGTLHKAPPGNWRGRVRRVQRDRAQPYRMSDEENNDAPPPRRRLGGRGAITLRVMGLDYAVLESDLYELFSAVGEVKRCWIHFDKTDRSLGTGGVTFADSSAAEEALRRYDGRVLDGKTLRLSYVD